jgi:hypothetical protein
MYCDCGGLLYFIGIDGQGRRVWECCVCGKRYYK